MGILKRGQENGLLFDAKDYELLDIVRDVLGREDLSGVKHLLTPYLHPRGIKELAASQGLRVAYAAANLLGSLEIGKAHDRIAALRALRDEALGTPATSLRRNTARLLTQIMKELVRSTGDERRALELAHRFRMAATGKTRVVRRGLASYRLLLMPEDEVQLSFDNHVHDANTRGRKSATHLIMDAWIKGIRHLTVIYYNFVPPSVAEELVQAADILDISVRVGIEFTTRHRDRQAKLIWVPRGFSTSSGFLDFLRTPACEAFMRQGQDLARFRHEQILAVLERFNRDALPDLNLTLHINAPPVDPAAFVATAPEGGATLIHLARHIHALLLPHLKDRYEQAREELQGELSPMDRAQLANLADELNMLDVEAIMDEWLDPLVHPDPSGPSSTGASSGSMEQALYCPIQTPAELIDSIQALRVGSRLILNLAGLDRDDVLEFLHATAGRVTHLEVVNLKNAMLGNAAESAEIARLMQVVNAPSVIPLKRWVLARMARVRQEGGEDGEQRLERLNRILEGVPFLHARYRDNPLRATIGSDSTGQSCHGHGMGMVAVDTLPPSERRLARRMYHDKLSAMVVDIDVEPRLIFEPRESANPLLARLFAFARERGLPWFVGYKSRRQHVCAGFHPVERGTSDILVMGGTRKACGNHFPQGGKAKGSSGPVWPFLNTRVKNILKILAGFAPAFLTFALTKDWWLLAWFGGLIWFAITGLRNIIQSVLGGGGLSRTPLLKWNDYVSWERISESLLFTGFSVPLLDFLVKSLILDKGLGITVATSPAVLYTVMALVNGTYICSHNLARGLPRRAAFLNLGRSALSIPLATALSALLAHAISPGNPAAADPVLQQWAAVISKLASDCVAGIIEGLADRENNMMLRLRDYREKIAQTLAVQEKLEILFPKADVEAMLSDQPGFVRTLGAKRADLVNAVIVNSLDYLYFWMYQPRGRSALKRVLREMDLQTRRAFLISQYVLVNKREISQVFLDGILGKNFSRGLAFYLDYADAYLEALQKLAADTPPPPRDSGTRSGNGQRLDAPALNG